MTGGEDNMGPPDAPPLPEFDETAGMEPDLSPINPEPGSNVVAFDRPVGLEDTIAERFTRKHGETMRFDHHIGKWFQWSETHWRRLEIPVAFHFAREIGRAEARRMKIGFKSSNAAGAEKFARADPMHAVTSEIWDRDPIKFGTPLGIINLTTGKLAPPSPEQNITKLAGCEPSSKEPTLWLRFLNDATGEDQDMIDYLQTVAGYCLTGLTTEHALFFIYGPGGNGKSVFINVLKHIMGDYAVTAAMETFTASKFDRHSTELAMLKGARAVFASETEEGRQWAEAKVKAITGGDPITARFMRQDNFTFNPSFKLVIAGNHAPGLKNVDEAMRRRFHIIPFTRKPKQADPMLEVKLRSEAPQILGWAIRGAKAWQMEGLKKPVAVFEATEQYFEAQDVFGQWLDERCRVERENHYLFTPTADLFASYNSFRKEVGEGPVDMRSFGPEIEKAGFRKGRSPASAGKKRGFEGIELIGKTNQYGYND